MNNKAAAARGADRISDLPDALLQDVLSLLPADQAVQTSVLARRWRHLWKGMPALRLVGPKTRFATAQDFDRFVNRLIAVRGHLPLVSCEVEAYLTWDDYAGEPEEPEPNLYFDSWIQYALACKVQVLKVVGDVVGCESELIVPLISQHLVNLDVHHVCMEKDSVDFSSCPVLEELKMKECGLWVRSMSFPSLKRLFLTECNFPVDRRVSISAPGIVSLRLLQCGGKTPLLESMPLLETASIDLSRYECKDKCGGCTDESCEGCHGYPVGSYRSVLLNVLSNAINLELKDQPEVYIYKRDLECCPIFGRLKTLLLDMWCRHVDMHALVLFLQHTPILEKLTLQLRSDKNLLCAGRGERKHVRIGQSFSCAHLKEVSIECEEKLRVQDKVRQIVKILNRSGILKEQITFKKLPRPEVYRLVAVSPRAFDDNWSGGE
ncbi:F-box/LRR-repeat protein At3g59190-like [Miscanthus floridulus]|uniref:F-box/LRR-repeat protein At3g59190-like n=1 Tax=Miscanthus floridulus TaxID=154761 RepID=UPI003459A116